MDKTHGFANVISEYYAFVTNYRERIDDEFKYLATYKSFGGGNDYRLESVTKTNRR